MNNSLYPWQSCSLVAFCLRYLSFGRISLNHQGMQALKHQKVHPSDMQLLKFMDYFLAAHVVAVGVLSQIGNKRSIFFNQSRSLAFLL